EAIGTQHDAQRGTVFAQGHFQYVAGTDMEDDGHGQCCDSDGYDDTEDATGEVVQQRHDGCGKQWHQHQGAGAELGKRHEDASPSSRSGVSSMRRISTEAIAVNAAVMTRPVITSADSTGSMGSERAASETSTISDPEPVIFSAMSRATRSWTINSRRATMVTTITTNSRYLVAVVLCLPPGLWTRADDRPHCRVGATWPNTA